MRKSSVTASAGYGMLVASLVAGCTALEGLPDLPALDDAAVVTTPKTDAGKDAAASRHDAGDAGHSAASTGTGSSASSTSAGSSGASSAVSSSSRSESASTTASGDTSTAGSSTSATSSSTQSSSSKQSTSANSSATVPDGGCTTPEGGPACTPGTIECGGASCTVPAHECCIDPTSASCQSAIGACPNGTTTQDCQEKADCPNGSICCFESDGNDPDLEHYVCQTGTSCGGETYSAQVCRSDQECGGAYTCGFYKCFGNVMELCDNASFEGVEGYCQSTAAPAGGI